MTGKVQLTLYVAKSASNSRSAIKTVEQLKAEHPDLVDFEVVDALAEPLRALDEGVLVTPTLVCLEPVQLKVIGGLRNARELATLLGIDGDQE